MAEKYGWRTGIQHITAEGINIIAVFESTWTEWESGSSIVPQIGEAWTDERKDLRCVNIGIGDFDNVNVKIKAVFSTQGSIARRRRPNEASSWEESFGAGIAGDTIYENFYTHIPKDGVITPHWENWQEAWIAQDGDVTRDAANLPHPTIERPRVYFRVTAYSDTWLIHRICSSVGYINKSNFISYWAGVKSAVSSSFKIDRTLNDKGCWLITSMDAEPVSSTCIGYTINFEFNPIGWNHTDEQAWPVYDYWYYVSNKTTAGVSSEGWHFRAGRFTAQDAHDWGFYPYKEFSYLFEGMVNITPEVIVARDRTA